MRKKKGGGGAKKHVTIVAEKLRGNENTNYRFCCVVGVFTKAQLFFTAQYDSASPGSCSWRTSGSCWAWPGCVWNGKADKVPAEQPSF